MQTVFGLDFGTTNSALSVNTGGNTEVIDIDPHNPTEKTMRSVIFMDQEQGVYLGQEAIVQYIEQGGHGRFISRSNRSCRARPSNTPTSTANGTNWKI